MLKVGDTVSFLDEPGTGEILSIEDEVATVLCDTGFEDQYPIKLLVPYRDFSVGEVVQKDQSPASQGGAFKKASQQSPNKLEADLHFGELVQFPKNFSAHEKLNIQLNEARKTIDKARRAGIKKVILIHGVGQGRLKEEVHSMLERMDRLTFFDASFAEYGSGATEVELFGS